MTFRIADTFSASLERLTADERSTVNDTTIQLMVNPAHPSLSFHRLEKARDKDFWSVRASDDLRVIVHRSRDDLLVCYAGHHDGAYRWAERRKLDKHPVTGAAQFVEIRERVEEIVKRVVVPVADEDEAPEGRLFEHLDEAALMRYGVPKEWVADVQSATESTLYDLADHLPAEAADALLQLAVGEAPDVPPVAPKDADPFEHPSAQRRFRVVTGIEELEQALAYPWERWIVFLHPAQRELVERSFSGPARVSGSAGTGKTIVALHRAVHLARRNDDARVLLATFSEPLARHLEDRVRLLIGRQPRLRERLDVTSLDALALRLFRSVFGAAPVVADREAVVGLLGEASERVDPGMTPSFLVSEWEQVVDARQLRSWDDYRDVPRLGRKVRMPESTRARAWSVFDRVWGALEASGRMTQATVYQRLAEALQARSGAPYDHVVLDEAQDASAAQLRFLAHLVGDRPDGLFFAGDLGQRIFQQPFSWLSVGVDVRGRARTLKVNYRTSHQIRTMADRLLDERVDDVDGETQDRRGTVSVFNGPTPSVNVFDSAEDERDAVATWLQSRVTGTMEPHEIAIFVRSDSELSRAIRVAETAGLPHSVLTEVGGASTRSDAVRIATMHRAKGLEFRAVAVIACDEDAIPSADRLEQAADMVELQEVHDTERHLLYVALTRARDELWVSGVVPGSEYLGDLA